VLRQHQQRPTQRVRARLVARTEDHPRVANQFILTQLYAAFVARLGLVKASAARAAIFTNLRRRNARSAAPTSSAG